MRNSNKRVLRAVVALVLGLGANLPLTASPASAAIPTATIVNAFSGFNSDPVKTIPAVCPAGTHVIGGGAQVSAGHIFITQLEPVSTVTGDRFVVTAQEDEIGTGLNWFVRAQAVCADAQFVPGHHIVPRASALTSTQFVNTNSNCDDGQALGAGVRTVGAGNQAHVVTQIALAGPGTVSVGAFEDPSGFGGNWQVIGYAICADIDLFDRTVVVVDTVPSSVSPKRIEVLCPEGFRAVSGTAFTNAFASVTLVEVAPDRSRVVVEAAEVNATAVEWSVQVRALCVLVA